MILNIKKHFFLEPKNKKEKKFKFKKKKKKRKKKMSADKTLLFWATMITDGYPGVNVSNFTTSFKDGLAFCAIIVFFFFFSIFLCSQK